MVKQKVTRIAGRTPQTTVHETDETIAGPKRVGTEEEDRRARRQR